MIYYKTLNLSKDGKCGVSLTNEYKKVEYPLDGTPVEVEGKGAFIAPLNGKIFAGGVGKIVCEVKTFAPVEEYDGQGVYTCKKISLQRIDFVKFAQKLKDEGSIRDVILYSNLPKEVIIRLAEKLEEELNIYFVIHCGNLPVEVKKWLKKKIK